MATRSSPLDFRNMAMGQNPGTPVNTSKTFKIDYLGRVIIPKKVPL